MYPQDLPAYRWPDMSAVSRQYVVVDDHGRYGIARYDSLRGGDTLWAHPIDMLAEQPATLDMGLPRGAVLMTATSWTLQPDGRYRGIWCDYNGPTFPARVPETLMRYLTIVSDLGWVMPDKWAAQALAGSADAGVWNYGARLGIIPGKPPVAGQTGDEMTVAQAEEYAREVGQPVTGRSIAEAAASGLIPGSRLVGADWLIPYDGMNSYLDRPGVALGRVTSPAKAAAARDNGRKGGRPRKTPPTEPE